MAATEGSPGLLLAARSLLLEWEAGICVKRLRDAGVTCILLKGPAIARWLYDDRELRPYRDVDLLVSTAQFSRAVDVLAEAGYVHRLAGAAPAELGPKERELVGPDNVCIDLHAGLLGVPDPQQCWEVLLRHTVLLRLHGGAEVPVLDLPARAMHLALHAAQNGPVDWKALSDLRRGLERLDRKGWLEAARLAAHVDATEAFAAGLRLVPEGAMLASDLSLPRQMRVELVLRTQSAPQESIFFERLREAGGPHGKAALILRKVFPTTVFLRANSAWALRGRFGLFCARLYRPVSLAGRLWPAYVAWSRARRTAAGSRPSP